jgi:hypothetical protein
MCCSNLTIDNIFLCCTKGKGSMPRVLLDFPIMSFEIPQSLSTPRETNYLHLRLAKLYPAALPHIGQFPAHPIRVCHVASCYFTS